jgi:hypothetical protein
MPGSDAHSLRQLPRFPPKRGMQEINTSTILRSHAGPLLVGGTASLGGRNTAESPHISRSHSTHTVNVGFIFLYAALLLAIAPLILRSTWAQYGTQLSIRALD